LASKLEKATLAGSVMMHRAALNRALPSAIGSEIKSYKSKQLMDMVLKLG
jgi:hypothetical protein